MPVFYHVKIKDYEYLNNKCKEERNLSDKGIYIFQKILYL